MNCQLKYISCTGEVLDLNSDYAYFSECGLRDWSYSHEMVAGAVTRLYRDRDTVSVPITLTGTPGQRDAMTDMFLRDVTALQPGTLDAAGWCRRCFAVAAKPTSSWASPSCMEYEVSFLMVDPMWTRRETFAFPLDRTDAIAGKLGYPHNLPCDLGCGRLAKSFSFTSISACDFRLTIYGGARSPYVVIGANNYQVNVDLEEGALLIVDSREKTVQVVSREGSHTNVFNKRVKGNTGSGRYIFERIKSGFNSVSWDNTFGFDLEVYTERPEPSWS